MVSFNKAVCLLIASVGAVDAQSSSSWWGGGSSSSSSSYSSNHKDDSYYNANHGNPNVDIKMYWKDAENVMMDLSLFSSLYVKFHQCVWTGMQQSKPGYQEVDNDVDENDYWYQGSVPPMGANAAFTLYGSLKGESFSGCNADTFINSFYTTTGFDDFVEAMNFAGQSGFSSYADGYYNTIYYSSNEGGDGDGEGDRRKLSNNYNSNGGSSLTAYCQGGYGIGCDYNYGFAMHQYKYNECNPQNATYVLDDLSSLNSALKKADCVKIWNGGSSYGNNNNSAYSNYDNYENSGSAVELLYHSKACSFMNYWSPDGGCPDPYNKVYYYLSNYNQGIKRSWPDPYKDYEEAVTTGKRNIRRGALFCGIAFLVLLFECCRSRPTPDPTSSAAASKDVPPSSYYPQDPQGSSSSQPMPEGTYDQPQIHVTGEDPTVTYTQPLSGEPPAAGGPYIAANPSGLYDRQDSYNFGATSPTTVASYPNDPQAQQALVLEQQQQQIQQEQAQLEQMVASATGAGVDPLLAARADSESPALSTSKADIVDPIGQPIETNKSTDSALYATGTVWHHDPPPQLNEGLQYTATGNIVVDDVATTTTSVSRQPPFPEQIAPKPPKSAHFDEDSIVPPTSQQQPPAAPPSDPFAGMANNIL